LFAFVKYCLKFHIVTNDNTKYILNINSKYKNSATDTWRFYDNSYPYGPRLIA